MDKIKCKYCKGSSAGMLLAHNGYVCADCLLGKMDSLLKENEALRGNWGALRAWMKSQHKRTGWSFRLPVMKKMEELEEAKQ